MLERRAPHSLEPDLSSPPPPTTTPRTHRSPTRVWGRAGRRWRRASPPTPATCSRARPTAASAPGAWPAGRRWRAGRAMPGCPPASRCGAERHVIYLGGIVGGCVRGLMCAPLPPPPFAVLASQDVGGIRLQFLGAVDTQPPEPAAHPAPAGACHAAAAAAAAAAATATTAATAAVGGTARPAAPRLVTAASPANMYSCVYYSVIDVLIFCNAVWRRRCRGTHCALRSRRPEAARSRPPSPIYPLIRFHSTHQLSSSAGMLSSAP